MLEAWPSNICGWIEFGKSDGMNDIIFLEIETYFYFFKKQRDINTKVC